MFGYALFSISIVVAALASLRVDARERIEWRREERPYLEARSKEAESDAMVRASCALQGRIQLRLGAYFSIGRGEGEPVSITVDSGAKTASVKGVSKFSPDSEMTGGTELVAEVGLDDPVVDILFSGRQVTIVTPGKKKERLLDADASGVTKKFVDDCRGR